MVKHITTWFRQGLGARIDALELALDDLAAGQADALETLKRLAFSVSAPAKGLELNDICEAAENVRQGSRESVAVHARELIKRLRREASKATATPATVLIVGGEPSFVGGFSELIRTPSREVIHAPTAAAARKVIEKGDVACIVLSLFLPDMDGRTFFTRLQEDTRTASVPVLLLASSVTDTVRQDNFLNAADNVLDGDEDPKAVAEWVNGRLRRAHAKAKASRRDGLTGLLNRPAFREDFERLSRECDAAHEPLSLAAVSMEGSRELLNRYDPKVQEELVQSVGLVLSRSLRTSDILGRWNQFEFAVLFPGENQFGGCRAVSKVIDQLNSQALRAPDGTSFVATVSAGVVLVSPGASLDDAMTEADSLCFQAAEAGGNRVVTDGSRPAEELAKRVLLLLQDANTTAILRQLFQKDAFEVTHADKANGGIPSGEGAQHYHLIVIDEQIPSKGGFEALQEIRGQPENSRTPVVMLITNNTEENIVRALQLGANDYIVRPFSPFTFMHRMRRLLSRGVATESKSSPVRSVLLVDDDAKALILAATALHQRGGFKVYLALGGQEGADRFAQIQPDALIVSVAMQGMDGLDLLGKLPEQLDLNRKAIILATEADETRPFKELLSAGVRGCIRKPFDPLTFGSQVEKLMGVARGEKATPDLAAHFSTEVRAIMTRPAGSGGA